MCGVSTPASNDSQLVGFQKIILSADDSTGAMIPVVYFWRGSSLVPKLKSFVFFRTTISNDYFKFV
jgi:hypothetical protein